VGITSTPHTHLLNYDLKLCNFLNILNYQRWKKVMTATRLGIENKAGSGEIKNLTDLCYEVLEPVEQSLINQLQLHLVIVARLYAKQ
jgi:hypothetical protein